MKHFSCWKTTEKKNDKEPDYRLTTNIDGQWVEIGAGWVKSAGDKKYISFSLAKPFKDKKGWKLVEETEAQDELDIL